MCWSRSRRPRRPGRRDRPRRPPGRREHAGGRSAWRPARHERPRRRRCGGRRRRGWPAGPGRCPAATARVPRRRVLATRHGGSHPGVVQRVLQPARADPCRHLDRLVETCGQGRVVAAQGVLLGPRHQGLEQLGVLTGEPARRAVARRTVRRPSRPPGLAGARRGRRAGDARRPPRAARRRRARGRAVRRGRRRRGPSRRVAAVDVTAVDVAVAGDSQVGGASPSACWTRPRSQSSRAVSSAEAWCSRASSSSPAARWVAPAARAARAALPTSTGRDAWSVVSSAARSHASAASALAPTASDRSATATRSAAASSSVAWAASARCHARAGASRPPRVVAQAAARIVWAARTSSGSPRAAAERARGWRHVVSRPATVRPRRPRSSSAREMLTAAASRTGRGAAPARASTRAASSCRRPGSRAARRTSPRGR